MFQYKKCEQPQNLSFKALEKGRVLYTYSTEIKRRFFDLVSKKINKFLLKKGGCPKFYLRVDYGRGIDPWGNGVQFYNDAYFHTRKEFKNLFKQFTEV